MIQGGLKKVQGGLEPPLAPYFPRLCAFVPQFRWPSASGIRVSVSEL